MSKGLHEPLNSRAIHLCVDMQRIFSHDGLWPTPWMERVLPVVEDLSSRFTRHTVFTRFITPARAEEMPGRWRRYYERWGEATRERLPPEMLELMPPLKALVPPATVIDKTRYSAFAGSRLRAFLMSQAIDTLIVTGSETDVCVLSTVMDAVDLGFRVILVRDGVCSSSDEGHDASLAVYGRRYAVQIETVFAEEIVHAWRP